MHTTIIVDYHYISYFEIKFHINHENKKMNSYVLLDMVPRITNRLKKSQKIFSHVFLHWSSR